MKTQILTTLLLATFVFSVSNLNAQDQNRTILLKSGRILDGNPVDQGKLTRINLADGEYFVIESEKIEKKFRSRRDCFNYKTAVTALKPREQANLLYWLVDQGQFDLAFSQLEELSRYPDEMQGFNFDEWRKKIEAKKNKMETRVSMSVATDDKKSFISKIENHLRVGCGLSGCHQMASGNSFELDISQPVKISKTENYLQTLEVIKSVGSEEFLKKVSQKHASLNRGIFPTATSEYLEIATWVNSSKRASQPKVATTLATPRKQKRVNRIPQIGITNPKKSDSPIQSVATDPVMEGEFVPRDEFDPEIFNRMYVKTTKDVTPEFVPPVEPNSTPQRLISPPTTRSRK